MMDFREQLEGGARFSRIRGLKRMALGLQVMLVLVMALVILVTSGLSINPFYLPLNATIVPVFGYLLVIAAQNFAFRYLEIKHSRSDGHRYLIAKNTTSNAAWVIGLCAFALGVLVVVVHSGWAAETLTREGQAPVGPSSSSTYILVYEQDPFGFTEPNWIESTLDRPGVLFPYVRDNETRRLVAQPWQVDGSNRHPLTLADSRKFDIVYNNTGTDLVLSWRLIVEPSPALQVWMPLLLVGFIGSNAGWIAFMRPKKAQYKAASIYSAEFAQQAEAGEETFQQYLDRTAEGAAPASRPTIGAQVKPGVFTTDRSCPVCTQSLVWVQKYSRHYCLTCKAYRAATGTPGASPVVSAPLPTGPAPPPPAPPLAAAPVTVADRPPCPTCGRPLLWVEKHTRFYCLDEKKYAPRGFGQIAAVVVPAPSVAPLPVEGLATAPPSRPVPAAKETAVPLTPARTFSEDANAAYQLGDYRTAITLFDQAIEQDPKNLNAYLSKAAAQMKVGQRLEALTTLDRAIFLDPKNERTLRVRALILEGEKRWNEALDAYDAFLAVKPTDVDFLVKKGDALLALGRREEASAQFEKALALAPREQRIRSRLDELKFDVAGVLSRALLASAGGNYSQAIALFDQVVLRDPGSLNALMGKAVALRRSGDSDGAHEVIRKVLLLAPKHPAALMTLGRILEDLGRSADALNAYTEFLDVSPQDAEGWERQGDLLGKMGRTTESLFAFQQALRTRPGDLRLLEKVKGLEPKMAAQAAVVAKPPTKPPKEVPPAVVVVPAKAEVTPPKEVPKPADDVPVPTVWAPPEKQKDLPSLQTLISPQPSEPVPKPPEPAKMEPPAPAKVEGRPPAVPAPAPTTTAEPSIARETEPQKVAQGAPATPIPESPPPPVVVSKVPPAAEPKAPEPQAPQPEEIVPEPRIEEPPALKPPPAVAPEPEEVIVEREAEEVEEIMTPVRPVQAPVESAADVVHEPTEQETQALKAALAEVKGVGPARLKALLKAGYTSVERVRAASEEELSEVKGLSRKVAKAIKDSL